MRLRGTLVALLILAALSGILWMEYRSDMEKEEAEARGRLVLDPGPGGSREITGLDLIRGGETLSLERRDGGWSLTAPVAAPADALRVEDLIGTLASLEIVDRVPSPEADLAQYGLDPPRLVVILRRGEGGPGMRLAVGDAAPVGRARYARLEGEAGLLTVEPAVGRLLEVEAEGLRYSRIVDVPVWKIASFSLEGGAVRAALRKGEEGWSMESPRVGPADQAEVSGALAGLAGMEADGYAPPGAAPEALGLESPAFTLALGLEEGGERTVRFAPAEGGGLWALRDDMDVVFRVPRETVEALLEQAAAIGPPAETAVAGQGSDGDGDS